MDIARKQLGNGFAMPVYGLGTWRMGGDAKPDDGSNDKIHVRAIESAIEHGVTHIDTAEMYAAGRTEELIATATKRFDRDSLFITTKLSPGNARRDDVEKHCEASLRRLQMDHVDLYLLHAYAPDIPLAETMEAMDRLVERELVINIGVSNFGPTNLQNAMAVAAHPIVTNQVHYSLGTREAEASGLLSTCQENDVMLAAWRPVRASVDANVSIVEELAKKYEKTPIQIALNWLVSQDRVVTLAKTSTDKHLEENLGALDFVMEQSDVEYLRSDFPDQHMVSTDVPLDRG